MNRRFLDQASLAGGVIGPPLFILVFLIEGMTRPGYNAWRHAVSQLSLGELGWINGVTIIMFALCLLSFAFGLRRALQSGRGAVSGPRLAFVCGLMLVLLGIFPVNPGLGYPPGVPLTYSLHGLIHATAATIFFGCLSALCFVLARRFTGDHTWRVYSIGTGVVVAVFYVLATLATTLAMNGAVPDAPGGLLQRIAIISGLGWIILLAFRLLRSATAGKPRHTS
jgi:hypothetical membrane protein